MASHGYAHAPAKHACAFSYALARSIARSIDARESWLFSLSSTQSFQEKRLKIKDLATLKRFVAVIGRPVPCTARLASDRDRQTDRQTKYRNPRCACAPRVNYHSQEKQYSHHISNNCTTRSTYGQFEYYSLVAGGCYCL